MNYSNIIFPINFYQKCFKLSNEDSFIKVDKRNFIEMVFEEINFLVVEIGFGKGDFLIHYSSDYPNKQFVGIEKSDNLVKEVAKRLERNGIRNVRLINAKAEFALYFLFPDSSIDMVIINFPDPWPKKAHIERRLVNSNFLKLLSKKLKKGSSIYFSTDVENYKDFVIDSLKKINNLKLENVILGFWEERYQTKYLKKWLKQNKKIFSLHIIKMY